MNNILFGISIKWIKASIIYDIPDKRKGFIKLLAYSINGNNDDVDLLIEFVMNLDQTKQDVKDVLKILQGE